ncbi:quinone oxidoreductase family protein [Congregibacter litoralis]|uniref:NADPH:quinone reductase n=1 Tax=Congregibacter litoralis KT71 TaxID=314285 RepID=A4ACK6_9GAMM|nr:quinone oxidoreductase [Congregibacter litoralis]EAQ96220.1 NADPH:quinone reductase [Congregibacter litoralis KT71]
MKKVEIQSVGGPEVLRLVDAELEAPGPGMVRVANRAIGLNYIDTYHRSGLYPLPLPTGIGLEGAGVVEAIGDGVDLAVGDRVAYCAAGFGAYSEAINLPAERLVAIPEGIDFDTAAAVLLKGATVEYLIQRTYALTAGEQTLFPAAAGGVGLIFGQWAAALGAELIGTVSSEAKRELALANGYTHCFLSDEPDLVAKVREITGGKMLPVVYDGVGAATFTDSLDCLAPRGLMVSFGNASGSPPPFDLQQLAARGSLYITRPSLMAYVASKEEMRASAAAVFDRVLDGRIKVTIAQRYPLAEVQRAHAELEARRTVGSSLLLP